VVRTTFAACSALSQDAARETVVALAVVAARTVAGREATASRIAVAATAVALAVVEHCSAAARVGTVPPFAKQHVRHHMYYEARECKDND
jgi:hypothetical protein